MEPPAPPSAQFKSLGPLNPIWILTGRTILAAAIRAAVAILSEFPLHIFQALPWFANTTVIRRISCDALARPKKAGLRKQALIPVQNNALVGRQLIPRLPVDTPHGDQRIRPSWQGRKALLHPLHAPQ